MTPGLAPTSATVTAAIAPVKFDLAFNPLSPLPGQGPSRMTARVEGDRVPDASFTDTQNPNYLRAGTHWSHGDRTPDFAPTADRYANALTEAAEALAGVPADGGFDGSTPNGKFELTIGDRTWSGSLLGDGREPVRNAVDSLRQLAGDLRRGVPGFPNSV